MKKMFLAGLTGLSLLGVSFAVAQVPRESLAVTMAKEAGYFVGFFYNGYRQIPTWRDFQSALLKRVNDKCGTNFDCPASVADLEIRTYLRELNDPFTSIQTLAEAQDELRAADGQGSINPTFGMRVVPFGGGLLVREIFPGEPAFDTELAVGDVIASLNGQPATLDLYKQLEAAKSSVNFDVSSRGAKKLYTFAAKVAEAGRTPLRSVVGNNMLIRIPNMWLVGDRVHNYVARAIRDNVKGIVIDLRDAQSGYDSEAVLAAGAFGYNVNYFSDARIELGDYRVTYRDGAVYVQVPGKREAKVAETQRPQNWAGKVAVLVNGATENSSEMLAYWLQQRGATVIGTPTLGQLGVTGSYAFGETLFQMVNSDLVRVSTNRMKTSAGVAYPERVTPDVIVPDDLTALSSGQDVQLQKALDILR